MWGPTLFPFFLWGIEDEGASTKKIRQKQNRHQQKPIAKTVNVCLFVCIAQSVLNPH